MKRWLICVCMMLAVVLLATPAQAEEFSGTCGENLTWNFDQSTGTLTISGEGAMEDYPFSALEEYMVPWYVHRDKINAVVMKTGITHIGSNAFLFNHALVSVVVPDTVTSIGQGAFYECTALEKIVLPDSVTEVDYSVFAFCTSLTDVRLSEGLKLISCRMFEGCKALVKINLPESVTSIEACAFMDCEGLMNIRIPGNVSSISNHVFEDCNRLLNVVFMGSAPEIASGAFYHSYPTVYYSAEDPTWTQAVIDKVDRKLEWIAVDDPAGVKLPEAGDVLEGKCGPDAKWRLEKGTLSIAGTGAVDTIKWFGYRNEITTVIVSNGITNFGSIAHSNVEKITLPDTLTTINESAFRDCKKLEQITIPTNVTKIGANAFWGCIRLKRIVVPAGVKQIESGTFRDCDALEEIILPEALEYIGEWAFTSCDNLPRIDFPKNLKGIGDSAFTRCKKLIYVIFRGDAPKIHQFAFNEQSFYAYYPAGNKTWTDEVFRGFLGNKVWIAGSGETSGSCGTGLTWKITGDTLTISGSGRMKNYTLDALGPWTGHNAQIKKLVIKEGVTYIGQFAFYAMSGIKTVEFPEGLQEIAGEAFAGCGGIEELQIPNSVTRIGNYCFSGLIYLRKLTLGDHLESIGNSAFFDCQWLKEVTFPSTLKTLGRYAFSMCTRLKTAAFLGPAPAIAQDTFELSNTTIYYPAREESWAETAKRYFLGVKAFVADCIPEHTMGPWEITKEPTVDLYGEEARTCLYCDEFEVRDVPKLTPEEPDPTLPTEPEDTEPSQPSEPGTANETKPSAADTPTDTEELKTGYVIVFVVAAVAVSGGAVALAIVSRRKAK